MNPSGASTLPPPRNPPGPISFLNHQILLGEGIPAHDHGNAQSLLEDVIFFHLILIKDYPEWKKTNNKDQAGIESIENI